MSSDKSEEEEHEAVSKQIVDYYRKYSLNQHLPKYFSGTSLSYMPPIVKEEEVMPKTRPIIVIDDTNSETLVQTQAEPASFDLPEPKVVSPTSSVTSNRKLEWDNGADIGYSNYQSNTKLYKSHSLPILLVDTKNAEKSSATKLSTKIVTVISYPSGDDDDVDYKQVQSSSSSTSYPPEAPIISSSSSGGINIKKIVSTSSSSFASTLAYLKSKIGTPDAESTPKFPPGAQTYTDTPFAPKAQKQKSKEKNRIVNLCLTKPITVECFDKRKKRSSDKEIQTTFVETYSNKCIQTSDSLEMLTQEKKSECKPIRENQSVILITYDSDSDKRICSSNTQTDADIASPCESFEYYKQEKPNVSTDSSKDVPLLGQLITEKQSKSLTADVDRSIELLEKLLKSKKYDPVTKKRYIKKIVAKIVNSKYSEDSTASSELFVPKKQNDVIPQNAPRPVSKFTINTFRDEFVPNDEEHSGGITEHTRSASEKQQSLSSNSYQSWKDDKTTSERLLQEKQKGQGDHLVSFAMKERQHQIAWINDEISHLTQLKGLLEKQPQTTTTVYMVSQHPDTAQSNASSVKSRDSPRNYVIQTELSSSSGASGVPKDYNLYDKTGKTRYRVSELSKGATGGVVGDIEVVSDERTTNIKIKTKRCDEAEVFRPRPPSLIGPGKYDTFPKSKTEDKFGPCEDRQQSRRQVGRGGSYTFEVPLNCTIADKVRDIVNKYTKPGIDRFPKCECVCTCPKSSRNMELVCGTCCKCERSSKGSQKMEEMEKATRQTKPCGCSQRPTQTTSVCTKDATCCCRGCQNFFKKKAKSETVQCQTKACGCNQQVQTSVCTKDAECCCRECQDFTDKKGKATKVCNCDAQVQTTGCTKDAMECLDFANKKDKVQVSKCQTMACGCDEQVQTTSCTRDANCSCLRRKVENAKCQTRVCNCDEQVQTGIGTKDAQCGCQNSDSKEPKSENANCQTKICQCEEQSQTSNPTKDVACGCRDSIGNTCAAKCQTESCDCEAKQVQTSPCTKDASCTCCRCGDQPVGEGDPVKNGSDLSVPSGKGGTSGSSYTSGDSSDSGSSESLKSCSCCKRKNLKKKYLYSLKQRLCNHTYPLCQPCYKQNRIGAYPVNYCYTNAAHVCNCYTAVQTETLNEIKKTIADIEACEEFCTCENAESGGSSGRCKQCQRKKPSNGIAYLLTFENETPKKEKKHKKRDLEEVKIKIPGHKKRHKDKENKRKKQSYDSEATSSSGVGKSKTTSLQEYLSQNRPEFVHVAEGRRKTVNDSRTQREGMSDYNKLIFLQKCQEEWDKNPKRLFSSKEMKEITQRNYRKLPEVQKRLNDNKEKHLRQASRLIADTFNKKLRENVLKGKRNLPINVKVVSM